MNNLWRRRVRSGRGALPEVEISEQDGIRSLHLGSATVQSAMKLDDPSELMLSYSRSMMAWLLFCQQPKRVLQIGLGGGSIPRFLCHHYPNLYSDVVEINPQVVAVARSLFAVPENNAQLTVHVEDGVEFVQRYTNEYDAILVDAFDGFGFAAEILTEPFFHDCKQALGENGLFVINLWGGHRDYLQQLALLRRVFDDRVLTLEAETYGNIAAFAFTASATWSRTLLEKKAGKIAERTGLEMPQFLKLIAESNHKTGSLIKI